MRLWVYVNPVDDVDMVVLAGTQSDAFRLMFRLPSVACGFKAGSMFKAFAELCESVKCVLHHMSNSGPRE